MLKHICRFGCITLERIKDVNNRCIEELVNDLREEGINTVSSKEFILGLKCAETVANNIMSSSVYLTLDGLNDG